MRRLLALAVLIAVAGCGSGDDAPREATPVSVRVAPATHAEIRAWVYGQGTARAVHREFLTFAGQGRVTHVADLTVGSPVRAGQLIAELEPDRVQADLATAHGDLASARAARHEAQANLTLAEVTLERYRTLLSQDSASQQEYDEAQARLAQARAALQRADAGIAASQAQVAQARVFVSESRIVSPIDGVLARLNVEQGRYFTAQAVQTGSEQGALRTVPAVVIDPSRFEIRVDLPGEAFSQIQVGSDVLVGQGRMRVAGRDNADGSLSPSTQGAVRAQIHAISPALDPETRTFEALIRTTDGAERLQDGEFVTVWIARDGGEALTVPMAALRHRNGSPFVFVVDAQADTAHEREVRLGRQGDGLSEVVDGLRPGERVVTEGRARLSDGQRVRVLGDGPEAGTGP